ncbi:hypothetical protein ACQPZ2_00625 [Nocardia pseudovaccinii]|uniref:hypothetical protein n=1 Tax=Nocardia pseudovaccinii TaxID=189540 RepID=UPI003D8F5B22
MGWFKKKTAQRDSAAAPSIERMLILYERAEPEPGQIEQLVQSLESGYLHARLGYFDASLNVARITTYRLDSPTSDVALAVVAQRVGDVLERTTTHPLETPWGPIVLACVWAGGPPA